MMIELKGQPQPVASEITISVHMASGDVFVQPIPIDQYDLVQEFMDWYRHPGKDRVWEWHVVSEQSLHMIKHDLIMAIDIEGYIEPEGRSSRWYERILDRIRAWHYG